MREQLIQTIEKEKIIVIVRGVEKEKLLALTEAMYQGGIRILEITYSANGDVSNEETAENIRMLAQRFAGKMYIGAGTVLTEEQVELTAKAGGTFIVSPDVYPQVIEKTRALGLVSIPGALTPSEMQIAHRHGADFIKLFPVFALGDTYLKAVRAPLSHLKILAVGNVDEESIKKYLSAGACGIGLGTNIADKAKIEQNDWAGITKLAEKFVSLVK